MVLVKLHVTPSKTKAHEYRREICNEEGELADVEGK